MTSAIPMPVIPDPESDDVLFRMLDLILENPLCKSIEMVDLDIILMKKEERGAIERNFLVMNSEQYRTHLEIESKIKLEIPDGREGAEIALKIIKQIKKKDRVELPDVLQDGKLIEYTFSICVDWENFNWIDVKANVTSNTRKLEIDYYPNYFYDDLRVREDPDYLRVSHLSKPFLDLFQQFKSMFHREWPDKYIILPSISDKKERAKILSHLRKERITYFDPSNYRKMDYYFK